MKMDENEKERIFFEIHRDNPQEGPGDFESTRRAFSMLEDLPPSPRILDLGCGPGRQTIDLSRLTEGSIVAVDFHQPYIDALKRRCKELGVMDRISPQLGDMGNLRFEARSFDLIWSEGAIYNIGFKAGLRLLNPLLKKGGYISVTELTWLRADAPDELNAFFDREYPQMQNIEGNLSDLEAAGFKRIGHFVLPQSAWWDYYHPIEKRVAMLKKKYKGNSAALEMLMMESQEIEIYRLYAEYYGYVFYIGQSM